VVPEKKEIPLDHMDAEIAYLHEQETISQEKAAALASAEAEAIYEEADVADIPEGEVPAKKEH